MEPPSRRVAQFPLLWGSWVTWGEPFLGGTGFRNRGIPDTDSLQEKELWQIPEPIYRFWDRAAGAAGWLSS